MQGDISCDDEEDAIQKNDIVNVPNVWFTFVLLVSNVSYTKVKLKPKCFQYKTKILDIAFPTKDGTLEGKCKVKINPCETEIYFGPNELSV